MPLLASAFSVGATPLSAGVMRWVNVLCNAMMEYVSLMQSIFLSNEYDMD